MTRPRTEQQGYDEETKRYVENAFVNHADHGVDFIHVRAPKLAPPWPSYDRTFARNRKTTARVIADTVDESEHPTQPARVHLLDLSPLPPLRAGAVMDHVSDRLLTL